MKTPSPVLFIPGLACTETMWRHQIAELEPHTEVFTAKLPSINCLLEMTSRILSNAPEKFHCVGSSMGGYVALEMVRQAPERIRTLTLMVTTAEPDTDAVARRRQDLQASVSAGHWRGLWRSITPRFLSHLRVEDHELIEAFVDQISETCPDVFLLHQTAMMNRPCYLDLLPKIAAPTNVIIGEHDIIIPPEIQEDMAAKIPGAVKTYIKDCGHIPSMEQPVEVSRILKSWIVKHERVVAA